MKRLFIILMFPILMCAQDYGNNAEAALLCTYIQGNNFMSNSEADRALDRVLSVIGASKTFVLAPCDGINNALAISMAGERYISYDRAFMNKINGGNDWSNLFILAHEVGHHVNGHSLDIALYASDIIEPKTLAQKRNQELQADEFAGFILGKLGATREQAISTFSQLRDKDDSYSTHPTKSKRVKAVTTGFDKATGNNVAAKEELNFKVNLTTTFDLALKKQNEGKCRQAIELYNKIIELDPETLPEAYM